MSLFAFSLQEFVKGCGSFTKRWVDGLLDKMTANDHLKAVTQIRQVYGPCNYNILILSLTSNIISVTSGCTGLTFLFQFSC